MIRPEVLKLRGLGKFTKEELFTIILPIQLANEGRYITQLCQFMKENDPDLWNLWLLTKEKE